MSQLLRRLAFELFDTTILQILTYGGELWETSTTWIKVLLKRSLFKIKKSVKSILKRNRTASNSATGGELGRLSIQITPAKKTLKCYIYLSNKDENTICKTAISYIKTS